MSRAKGPQIGSGLTDAARRLSVDYTKPRDTPERVFSRPTCHHANETQLGN